MKAGKRSLYYHVRNFWLYAFKNCAWGDVLRAAWAMGRKALGGRGPQTTGTAGMTESELEATGTMGLSRSIAETPGGLWIVIKASLSALGNLPYCLARRSPVHSPDFKIPGL
jgi:hypothetical protein